MSTRTPPPLALQGLSCLVKELYNLLQINCDPETKLSAIFSPLNNTKISGRNIVIKLTSLIPKGC
jgi:hypothetical protein